MTNVEADRLNLLNDMIAVARSKSRWCSSNSVEARTYGHLLKAHEAYRRQVNGNK